MYLPADLNNNGGKLKKLCVIYKGSSFSLCYVVEKFAVTMITYNIIVTVSKCLLKCMCMYTTNIVCEFISDAQSWII